MTEYETKESGIIMPAPEKIDLGELFPEGLFSSKTEVELAAKETIFIEPDNILIYPDLTNKVTFTKDLHANEFARDYLTKINFEKIELEHTPSVNFIDTSLEVSGGDLTTEVN